MRKPKTNAEGVPIFRLESGQIVTAPDSVFLALREMPVNRYTWDACNSPETAEIMSLDPPVLYARVGWRRMSSAPKDGTPVLLVWQPPLPAGATPTVILTSWRCRKHHHQSRHHNCPNRYATWAGVCTPAKCLVGSRRRRSENYHEICS